MPPRFESRPILSLRAFTATLHGAVTLDLKSQVGYSLHLFAVIGAGVIARNVANQQVLDAVGPSSLGALYATAALLSGLLLAGFGWLSRGHDARRVTLVTHAGAAVAMTMAALVPGAFRPAALVKYVLMEVATALLLLVFGRLVGGRFAPREARKLAPRLGAGGILGGLAGGAVLSFGAPRIGSRWLYLVAALIALLPLVWLARRDRGERLESPRRRGHEQASSPALRAYGRLLALTALLMVATTTLVDYLFRFGAKRYYAADQLTAFFGYVVLVTGLVSLVFQLGLLDRLLERFGLFATAAVMPAALAVAGMALGVAPGVATIFILKLVDSGTNMTVQQATSSLLLAPLDSRSRSIWQGRIDGLSKRAGQVLAGAFLAAFSWPPGRILPLTLGLCALWLLSLAATRGRYIRLLTAMLRGGGGGGPVIRPRDGETLKLLERELEAAPPARAAVILDILAQAGLRASSQSLQKIARDTSAGAGALLAVDHLAKVRDLRALVPYVGHPRADVSVRTLVAVAGIDLQAAQRLARAVLLDEHRTPAIRAAAAGLLADTDAKAVAVAGGVTRDGDAEARLALAVALGATAAGGPAPVGEIVARLAADGDWRVAARALEALPRHATPEGIEVALKALERRELRGAAMRALGGVGNIAAERVAQVLAQEVDNPRVASALAWVLGRHGSPSAVGALVEALWARHAELRLAAAMALNSLKRRRPGVVIPLTAVAARHKPEIEFHARMRRGSHAGTGTSRAGILLRQLFKQRAQMSLECFFRLLALRYPEDTLRSTLVALSSADKRQRQIALELLDTLIDPELRQTLAAAVSDAPARRRAADGVALLNQAADEDDPFLAGLARQVLRETRTPVAPRRRGAREIEMSDTLIQDILELQSVSLFGQSSAEDLAELAALLTARPMNKGAVIFREGDSGDALYLIKSGKVALSRQAQVVEQLGPGDAFGVVAVLDQKPRELTATAATDGELRVLAGDDLLQLLAERPLFMHSIFRALTEALRSHIDQIALGKHSDVA